MVQWQFYSLAPRRHVPLKLCNISLKRKRKNPNQIVHINTLRGGWHDSLLLGLLSLLLCHGPRLDLCAAKYAVEETPKETDACCQPEHFSPTIQGVLQREEAENGMRKMWSNKWHFLFYLLFECLHNFKKKNGSDCFVNTISSYFVTGRILSFFIALAKIILT